MVILTLVPYDAGTFGSRTTPQTGTQLRKAAAHCPRGADRKWQPKTWNISISGVIAENGMIVNRETGQKIGYGALTKGQQILRAISDDVPLTAPKIGRWPERRVPKGGGRSLITVTCVYLGYGSTRHAVWQKCCGRRRTNAKLVIQRTYAKAKAMYRGDGSAGRRLHGVRRRMSLRPEKPCSSSMRNGRK